jgi:hypothetical protein
LAAASILEPEPPDDCGALNQSDLKGLLTELYYETWGTRLADKNASPADLWKACRDCMGPTVIQPSAFMLDFHRDRASGPCEVDTVNWFAVYGYQVIYWPGTVPGFVDGTIIFHYEGRYAQPGLTGNCPTAVVHAFTKVRMVGGDPERHSGTWTNEALAPDGAFLPESRQLGSEYVNPYLDTNEIRRVIDHLTIVMDDAYMHDATPVHPPDGLWEARAAGYAGGCWAGPDDHTDPSYAITWAPSLGRAGLWSLYVYKTPPTPGDRVDQNALAKYFSVSYYYDQSVPRFNEWQLASTSGPFYAPAGYNCVAFMSNWGAEPIPCSMYFDALKLEYFWGDDGDGGANSSAVALDDGVKRVQVAPNPVGRTARVSYFVPAQGYVDIVVFDVTGRAVLRAAQGVRRAGVQTATISVAGLPTGTYMARVSVNGVNTSCRFVVCR